MRMIPGNIKSADTNNDTLTQVTPNRQLARDDGTAHNTEENRWHRTNISMTPFDFSERLLFAG